LRLGLASATAVATVLLAACGGGAASPAEFRQQADSICQRYEQKIDALGSPSSPADLAEFVDQAIPIIEDGNDALRGLEPPDELADDWDRVLEIQDENLQTTRELQNAIHDNESTRAQDLADQLGSTDEESTRLARKLGLDHCGQSD
jgi:hypothetical protein